MITIASDLINPPSESIQCPHQLGYSEAENNLPTGPKRFPHSVDYQGRPPPPKAGYGWEQILSAIESNSLHLLRRTDKGQYEYEQWQASIDLGQYANVGQYIALELLHWPNLVDPADQIQGRTATPSDPPPQESDQEDADRFQKVLPRLTLRLNHYPFPVQKSVQYFVLWATRDMSTPQERDTLDRFLEARLLWKDGCCEDNSNGSSKVQNTVGDDWIRSPDLLTPEPGKKKEWIWFVNPVELRSVATVHHLHVFVRDVDI
ncbi:hypothetical protein BGW38_001050 [Lunasporangiospora selenospora]|uniref:Uncharacterized protein n=1 Tax=Lunasporangiospora selenospora TaxID=979761 RepID=A0A9P6FUE7_9FUNG|nr:hypothetical protein BGW38_001050 [Lunasporangiospora selenospora]